MTAPSLVAFTIAAKSSLSVRLAVFSGDVLQDNGLDRGCHKTTNAVIPYRDILGVGHAARHDWPGCCLLCESIRPHSESVRCCALNAMMKCSSGRSPPFGQSGQQS
jgi:hypothetical protein